MIDYETLFRLFSVIWLEQKRELPIPYQRVGVWKSGFVFTDRKVLVGLRQPQEGLEQMVIPSIFLARFEKRKPIPESAYLTDSDSWLLGQGSQIDSPFLGIVKHNLHERYRPLFKLFLQEGAKFAWQTDKPGVLFADLEKVFCFIALRNFEL